MSFHKVIWLACILLNNERTPYFCFVPVMVTLLIDRKGVISSCSNVAVRPYMCGIFILTNLMKGNKCEQTYCYQEFFY